MTYKEKTPEMKRLKAAYQQTPEYKAYALALYWNRIESKKRIDAKYQKSKTK
jgi:hypothetical protein